MSLTFDANLIYWILPRPRDSVRRSLYYLNKLHLNYIYLMPSIINDLFLKLFCSVTTFIFPTRLPPFADFSFITLQRIILAAFDCCYHGPIWLMNKYSNSTHCIHKKWRNTAREVWLHLLGWLYWLSCLISRRDDLVLRLDGQKTSVFLLDAGCSYKKKKKKTDGRGNPTFLLPY